MNRLTFTMALPVIALLCACAPQESPSDPAPADTSAEPAAVEPAPAPAPEYVPPTFDTGTPTVTESGLTVIVREAGTGTVAAPGNAVTVHYTGWLLDEVEPDKKGDQFDSSVDRDQPFRFSLAQRQVIAGWDEGVAGMRVGGKRTLIIPPDLAYGARGFPPVIPPSSTLVFDVELLGVEK